MLSSKVPGTARLKHNTRQTTATGPTGLVMASLLHSHTNDHPKPEGRT